MVDFLARQWWNAERFGFTPNKLRWRISNSGMPKMVCISIPKAGTHLVERALCKYPRLYRPLYKTIDEANLPAGGFEQLIASLRPGQVIFSHLFYTEERASILRDMNVHCLFMLRDLRDIVISEANYLSSSSNHIYHKAFSGIDTQQGRILKALEGCASSGLPSMAQLFDGFYGWLDSDAKIVRFEDLIGASGGGSTDQQRKVLSEIFEFIGISCDEECISSLASKIYSKVSPTFHRGYSSQWPNFFDEEIKQKFKTMTGDAIVRYGYESSSSW